MPKRIAEVAEKVFEFYRDSRRMVAVTSASPEAVGWQACSVSIVLLVGEWDVQICNRLCGRSKGVSSLWPYHC